MDELRHRLKKRKAEHIERLRAEAERLASQAVRLGARRVILFGSLVKEGAGLASDIDLLIELDSELEFLSRTAQLYRLLQPRESADILVYTPQEMKSMENNPLVRRALKEGQVLYAA